MNCETAREAISAVLDREPSGVEERELEAHLGTCSACRAWRGEAHRVTRMVRLGAVEHSPRPVEDLLKRLEANRPGGISPLGLARLALVAVAAAQIVITAPILLFGQDHEAPIHVAHEMGALDLALAVGFLAAAWRPGRALGMRTLVGAAAALLVITAILDLFAGRTELSEEAPHLLTVAGWLLLGYLATNAPPSGEDETSLFGRVTGWRARRAASFEEREALGADRPFVAGTQPMGAGAQSRSEASMSPAGERRRAAA